MSTITSEENTAAVDSAAQANTAPQTEKILSKQDFVGKTGKDPVKLFVPDLNGFVFIKHITVQQRNTLLAWDIQYDGKGNARAIPKKPNDTAISLIALSVVDQAGTPIFTDDELNNLTADMAPVIDFLFDSSNEINALTKVVAKQIEKN